MEQILQKKKELWKFLKDTDKDLHRQLRTSIFGITMNLPGRVGRFLSATGYHLMQRIFGFN